MKKIGRATNPAPGTGIKTGGGGGMSGVKVDPEYTSYIASSWFPMSRALDCRSRDGEFSDLSPSLILSFRSWSLLLPRSSLNRPSRPNLRLSSGLSFYKT